MPGWAGFIKWRAEEREYVWQQAYPVGLVKFLAIRLWYARELVQKACREELGIDGRYDTVIAYMRNNSEEHYLRRQRVAGRLPALYAEEVDRLGHQKDKTWGNLIERRGAARPSGCSDWRVPFGSIRPHLSRANQQT